MSTVASPESHGLVRPWERGNAFQLDRVEPSPALVRIVERHWIVRWDLERHEAFRQEVLPHPSINLVVEPTQSRVWGVPTRRAVRMLEGVGWAVGTKFQPGAFSACTGLDAVLLTDTGVPVDTAFGRRLDDCDLDPASIIAAIETLLAPWRGLDDPALALVSNAIESMRLLPPGARVQDIAEANHLATRTLQRLFRRYVGVGPKWVLKRLRIHQAVERIASDSAPDLTRLALELGYYDHAHFTRDFRLIVGRSPTAYAREAARGKSPDGE